MIFATCNTITGMDGLLATSATACLNNIRSSSGEACSLSYMLMPVNILSLYREVYFVSEDNNGEKPYVEDSNENPSVS